MPSYVFAINICIDTDQQDLLILRPQSLELASCPIPDPLSKKAKCSNPYEL